MTERRVRARVRGVVQGVGFRPHIYRLASTHGLGGFVLNDASGVLLEVEGDTISVDGFLARIASDAPPLASVEAIESQELAPLGEHFFAIVASEAGPPGDVPILPDIATCAACLSELFDPADRRYRYPFINCTGCGPRFTIVTGVPYDRAATTMSGFPMCADCRTEYEDPTDRRFHAEPIACPVCGPSLRFLDAAGEPIDSDAADALLDGQIVAVKGIGGFHLAAAAFDEHAVAALRARKHREEKPFALMVATLADAAALVALTPDDERMLTSHARPIVVAPRRAGTQVANAVAPGSGELGVMLPYSPLHHLLLAATATPLVMTSGNVSDEPIAYRDEDALKRLAGIADAFLMHNRPIHTRTDDSVVRGPIIIRRSRGYVPSALGLPIPAETPILAVGAELKNTFCLARGARAWVSHHVGDLRDVETYMSFREGITHLERLLRVVPRLIAHDLHPDYLSTTLALERDDVDLIGVQHHHAHLAAVLAEHDVRGPAVGAIFDGTGYGPDGSVWGGEILVGGLDGYLRAGHLTPVRMPGGERAIREPWRMACAWLATEDPPSWLDRPAWRDVTRLARVGLASPWTTSVGRLFDAVAALCGVRGEVTYEGQAAVELEVLCDPAERGTYEIEVREESDQLVLDPRSMIAEILADVASGTSVASVSARFHSALADATVVACAEAAARHGLEIVALGGGVFQNLTLLERTRVGLERHGLRVLVPRRLPPNDGGISYGQVAIAAASRGDVRA